MWLKSTRGMRYTWRCFFVCRHGFYSTSIRRPFIVSPYQGKGGASISALKDSRPSLLTPTTTLSPESCRYSASVDHPQTPPTPQPPFIFRGHLPLLHKAGESKDCVHLVSSHANDVGLTALHLDPLPRGPARADVAETFYLVDLSDSALATELKEAGKSVVYQVNTQQQ